MASPSAVGGQLARGRAVVQTPPVLARYLDDLRRAQEALELDRFFGRAPAPAGMFDDIDLPEIPDPVAAQRAVTAAPRSWLEDQESSKVFEMPAPLDPMADMLLDMERRRSLLASRLESLTPEQRARSIPAVGQQYEADRAAARAADIQNSRDLQTAAALAAAGVVGGGAMYGHMSQLAAEAAKAQAQNDFDLGPDLSGNPDGAMPMTIDIGQDSLVDWPEGRLSRMAAREPLPTVSVSPARTVTEDEIRGATAKMEGLFADDPRMNLEPDSPDDAIAAAPGPSIPVRRNVDMEDLPGPQLRSVRALIRAGIPSGRAMDIITKGHSMSPDEYRMVTGGRR